MIAVTLSLLTAAPAAHKNASAPTPIADLHDWWDGSVSWVNSHWRQIGIAVAAARPTHLLSSPRRTLVLKRAHGPPGHLTLTDIHGPGAPKTRLVRRPDIPNRRLASQTKPTT